MSYTKEQETLHEMSFAMGHAWAALPRNVCERLMDAVNGSGGLVDLAVAWAAEFDEGYTYNYAEEQAYLNKVPVDGYLDAVGDLFQAKWDGFIAGHVAQRLTA